MHPSPRSFPGLLFRSRALFARGFFCLAGLGALARGGDTAARFLDRAAHPQHLGVETLPDGSVPPNALFRVSEAPPARLPTLGTPRTRFPIVEVKLNGKPLLAVVDTGASTSVVTLDAAVRLGLAPFGNPPRQMGATGFGGDTRLVLGYADSLALGPVTVSHLLLAVPGFSNPPLPFPRVGDRRVEMLLGIDLMRAFARVEFNQPAGHLVFFASNPNTEPPTGGARLPFTLPQGHGPRITATLQNAFPLTLDTGGYFGLRLPASIARENQIHSPLMMEPIRRRSLTGNSATLRAGRHTLRLGPLTLQNLPVEINHGNEEVGERIGALLGNPVLSRMRWFLDFEDGHVTFFP